MGDSACPGEATILFDAGTTFFRAMKKSFAFILIEATSPYLHNIMLFFFFYIMLFFCFYFNSSNLSLLA